MHLYFFEKSSNNFLDSFLHQIGEKKAGYSEH